MSRAVPRPLGVEVLANLLLGTDDGAAPLPLPAPGGLEAALDRVFIDALGRPPCVVSFSGGRDSSAILALACQVARREGLPLPIPAIMRFPDVPTSDETSWQELVLNHLQLSTAEHLVLRDELDALGPAATACLVRHGVRWPANGYMHSPIIELASGGTVLTGVGGDELFSTTSPRRRARQLAVAALPAPLRERVWLARRTIDGYGWLTPTGLAEVRRGLARDEVRWPHRWDRAVHYWYASRAFAAMDGALSLVAEGRDVEVINPLLDRQVLAELAVVGGRRGFPSRTEAMSRVCRGLLPDPVLSRSTKASFTGAVAGKALREFVAGWDGTGVDSEFVSVADLRREIGSPDPDTRSVLLVQQAWLAAHGSSPASS